MRLEGRTVLITGAGSGIGAALTDRLAREGADLFLVGRREAPLMEVSERNASGRFKPTVIQADVTRREDVAGIVSSLSRSRGKLDILINNAGMVSTGTLVTQNDRDISDMIAVNLCAPILLTRNLFALLRASDKARVVNVGSMFGDIAFPFFAVYSATKFGMRGFSDALRRELAPSGIGVTYVAPRATRTPAADTFSHLEKPFSMKVDTPEKVATQIAEAIIAGKRNVYPGVAEKFFTLIQSIAPGVIDANLIKATRGILDQEYNSNGGKIDDAA